MESRTVDARGLSCPQPAMLTRQAVEKLTAGSLEVLVDSVTSRDNVIRTAQKAGWRLDILEESGDGFRLVFQK